MFPHTGSPAGRPPVDTGWDPQLFRTTGEARLAAGDSVGAARVFARLAADPFTTPAAADSLRLRLGDPAQWGMDWDVAVQQARAELRSAMIERSVNRAPLRQTVRLHDLSGNERVVSLGGGGVSVAAFWSRYCPPSIADLDAFGRVARHLDERGIEVLAISDEADANAVQSFMAARGHEFTTFLDPHGDARIAFENRGTPHYVVLGRDGRIRFTGHRAEDLLRQVAALQDD